MSTARPADQDGIAVKDQRHQGGSGREHAQAKLLCHPVAKVGGANFGDGQATFESLQAKGIITRPMPESLNSFVRISIGTEEENRKALTALKQVLN
mgnify:CR=1 FL=1